MKSNKTKMFTLIALASAANYALADNYQYEASIGLSDGDAESGNASADIESVNLSFVAHFSEVDTSKGPLAEASFLDRASSVSVNYFDTEADFGAERADSNDIAAVLRLVHGSGVTAELLVADGELERVNTESLGLSLGYYVAENTEIGISYIDVEVADVDTDSIFLGVKHVSAGDLAFSVEAAVGTVDNGSDDDTAYNFEGILYPTSQFGFGINFTTIDSDIDSDSFEFFADWFVTPAIGVTLSYSDSEIGDADADAISLAGRFRF